jgi:putative ABC transport system permease protein
MLKIVGAVDLFPTWYPGDGPLFVGDLDHFFTQAGRVYPYEVWFKTHPNADQRHIVATVRGLTALLDPGVDPAGVVEDGLNVLVTDWESAPLEILAQQRRPERQGLFGLLSVGFIASALLTVLGFFLYALASFRRRFIELGVLRAVGLSMKQMTVLLAWELAALILVGMVAGTALGVWVSAWFIPYLQVGVEASSHYPPFVVAIAWPAIMRIYLLFAILFLAALAGLTILLLRMKIFQAVKLGETV